MEYEDFVEQMGSEAGLDHGDAAATAQTVLRRLGRRLTAGEAHNLAGALPFEFQDAVGRPPGEERPEIVDASDFVAGVAGDLGISAEESELRTRAVFAVLYRALDPGDFRAVMSQLPEDLATLAAEVGGREAR